MPADSYLPLIVFIFVGLVVVSLFYIPAIILGPKVENDVKLSPFECGNVAEGDPKVPFNPRFYQVAILFLVFDVEIAFLYPWALVFGDLGWKGLVLMTSFMSVLTVGLVYVVRKRVLRFV